MLEKIRQYWPMVVAGVLLIGNGFVQAYQVEVLQDDMDDVQQIQQEQARTKVDIEYIQKDMEGVQDDVKEVKDLINRVLQKLGD